MPSRVRKGDLVAVVSGDDKGKRGRVLRVLPDDGRVIVEGVNLVYKHLRRSQQHPQGGRVRREAAIHVSNVMPIDPETNEPTRVKVKVEGGRRVRVAKRSGKVLDGASASRRGGSKSDKKAAKSAESGD